MSKLIYLPHCLKEDPGNHRVLKRPSPLLAARQRTGMTRAEFTTALAHKLSFPDLSTDAVQAWEKGKVPTPRRVLAAAAELASNTSAPLVQSGPDDGNQDLFPSNSLVLAGQPLLGSLIREWTPRRVDPETATQLGVLLTDYVRMDNRLGPGHLLSVMTAHLQHITDLIPITSGDLRRELLIVGAQYNEFAGWLHQDAGDSIAARQLTCRALTWAEAVQDPFLISYVLMRLSNEATDRGDSNRALGLAARALRYRHQLCGSTLALVYRQEARAYAIAGDETACRRALEAGYEAVAVPARNDADERQSITAYCNLNYIQGEEADCWMLLGQPHKAVRIFRDGLAKQVGRTPVRNERSTHRETAWRKEGGAKK